MFYFIKKVNKLETLFKNGYTTVRDYAEKKGITVQAVYMAIKQKRIDYKKFGSLVLVRE